MSPVTRLVCLAALVASLALLGASRAAAAERMWVGFHDDPSYRWVPDRPDRIKRAAQDGATIVRLLVQWNLAAPERPKRPANPFDPAYRLDDVDEAVRAAQENGQETMLTISGTPRWAGARKPNRMPRRLRDFRLFAHAIASRYSGRFEGYPFVRFWSVWNEPNLNLFLTPQFDRKGRSVAPANYAKLYAAAYTGIKAGNRFARVAIGETSARGRDRRKRGVSDTHSPGRFAELVAKANPRLRFDAWAHHPYPSNPNSKPGQKVRWPNVSLASLPRFVKALDGWFKRASPRIWVTEYGHQTRPEDFMGISYAKQARYVRAAISMARKMASVEMFIWFVYQDDQGQPWDSGLYSRSGTAKGRSPAAFRAVATPLDARNSTFAFRRGTSRPVVKLFARKYCANDAVGTPIGMTWRVFRNGSLVAVGQQSSRLRPDCTISARLRLRRPLAKGTRYVATFELNDRNGILLGRHLTIRAT
ncbi:MAG TPA: cellulase family glycosylhydrolase [Gaiellaceae bacterium]|nr:cellulase family glycosylhydrolase [Gaiellaceae bacterium]